MLTSPLEQFEILPIFLLPWITSVTNTAIHGFLAFFCFLFFQNLNLQESSSKQKSFYLIPTRWQVLHETLFATIAGLVQDNLGRKGLKYFPFLYIVFVFVLVSNLYGLVPFSFTTTSLIVVTLSLSITMFGGVMYISITTHKTHFFSAFLPGGTSLGLAFLLVPIEIVSYFFKPLSLAVRLFANMIAGHTLLKVISGFSWALIKKGGLFFLLHLVPLFVLVLLIGLELGVAVIQAYVFLVLSIIYLREGIQLH
jgi:ATP synthase subunit 6